MPFRSEAQRRKFYSDPKLRKYVAEFEAATPKGKLPERVGKKGLKHHLKRRAQGGGR